MDCGIICIKYLLDYLNINDERTVLELSKLINDKGLSVYNIVTILNQYHIRINAYKTYRLKHKTPYIMLLRGFKTGHYIVILEVRKFSVIIFDPVLKERKVNKLLLYLKFSFIILVML